MKFFLLYSAAAVLIFFPASAGAGIVPAYLGLAPHISTGFLRFPSLRLCQQVLELLRLDPVPILICLQLMQNQGILPLGLPHPFLHHDHLPFREKPHLMMIIRCGIKNGYGTVYFYFSSGSAFSCSREASPRFLSMPLTVLRTVFGERYSFSAISPLVMFCRR